MIEKSIYSYSNYKSYILDRIRLEPKAGHGVRQKLAKAAGCQVAYVSHVLAGDRDFNVEQAEAISRFFSMTSDETEYFIWLVEKERAGTTQSRQFFERLLQQKRDKYLQLKNRVNITKELEDSVKAIYYSDHLYSAIHMIITIPEFQTPSAISKALNLPLQKTSAVLEFLKVNGLIKEQNGRLSPTQKYLYLDKTSPFILQHHSNWRMQALQNIRTANNEDLHLSMALTLSEADAKKLQRLISAFIEEISETIKKSPEEKLMCLGLDFFSLC